VERPDRCACIYQTHETPPAEVSGYPSPMPDIEQVSLESFQASQAANPAIRRQELLAFSS